VTASALARAVIAFQDTVPREDEYGVNDDDAERGVLAAFKAAGIEVHVEQGAVEAEVQRRLREREVQVHAELASRLAAMSPEERLVADDVRAAFRRSPTSLTEDIATFSTSRGVELKAALSRDREENIP
jgi:hypothetical protein